MINKEYNYVFFSLAVWCSEDEERLVRDLFRDYNKLIRPVEAMNQTVVVEFGLSFIQLINVNEKNQIMTSNVWLQLTWMDYQLVWDPADYGGINVLRLPPDKVWKPDIVLFNNYFNNFLLEESSNCVMVVLLTGITRILVEVLFVKMVVADKYERLVHEF
ncbi:acetylcholine receptor subunit beta-like 1 [Trichonephila clavata]|uniref:Acetylcholine receptor subunit beta-like 1 n=1 Tax=Trichonephila clavata TaxID=2740835 RepID=A0A8X6M2R3_TRICU|nr:acetylcholine receptor subunit beta-like 1 [Trichonephila clavata]